MDSIFQTSVSQCVTNSSDLRLQLAIAVSKICRGSQKLKVGLRDPDADPHMTYCCIVFVRAPQLSIGTLNFNSVGSDVLEIRGSPKIQNWVRGPRPRRLMA